MPVLLVQWPEWQLRGLGWAAGIVPFMVMTDGAGRDAKLLQRTGRKGCGELGGLGGGSRESRWGKSVIKKKPRWARGWISGELKGWCESFELKKKGNQRLKKRKKRYEVMRLENFFKYKKIQVSVSWTKWNFKRGSQNHRGTYVRLESSNRDVHLSAAPANLCPEPISLQMCSATSPSPTARNMGWVRNNYFLLRLISKRGIQTETEEMAAGARSQGHRRARRPTNLDLRAFRPIKSYYE